MVKKGDVVYHFKYGKMNVLDVKDERIYVDVGDPTLPERPPHTWLSWGLGTVLHSTAMEAVIDNREHPQLYAMLPIKASEMAPELVEIAKEIIKKYPDGTLGYEECKKRIISEKDEKEKAINIEKDTKETTILDEKKTKENKIQSEKVEIEREIQSHKDAIKKMGFTFEGDTFDKQVDSLLNAQKQNEPDPDKLNKYEKELRLAEDEFQMLTRKINQLENRLKDFDNRLNEKLKEIENEANNKLRELEKETEDEMKNLEEDTDEKLNSLKSETRIFDKTYMDLTGLV